MQSSVVGKLQGKRTVSLRGQVVLGDLREMDCV
jgi:hypothetical protein